MITVAACQIKPAPDIATRKKQLQSVLSQAHSEHVDFICFPEGFLTGYYSDEIIARKNSLQIDSAAFNEWLELVSDYSSTIIIGFNEQKGDALYDSAAIIAGGKLLGVQRKHYVYHSYFTPGESFTAYTSKGITFGVAICLDMNYFEPARTLALQGASILFSPMCNRVSPSHPYATRPPYYSHFVARSFENHCWLVAADWVWPNDEREVCPGHTVVYDCNGKELARSYEGQEQLLVYTIARGELKHEKGKRVLGSSLLRPALEDLIRTSDFYIRPD